MKKNVDTLSPAISVVLPAYNASKYIGEAIDSIIRQSFRDFECLIIDDGSTDDTIDIVRSYNDERIVLIKNDHDFVASLNLGLSKARGKYIARMDADDIMHPDRLRIQHSIMEEETSIAVCGTWMQHIGKNIAPGSMARSATGVVEDPILQFLNGNFVFHPTVMMRADFLRAYELKYENYAYAEDLKLWIEIAKLGGIFYIESQPLLLYRISETQVSNQKREEQRATTMQILFELLEWLLKRNDSIFPEYKGIYEYLRQLLDRELTRSQNILQIMSLLLNSNKNRLTIA